MIKPAQPIPRVNGINGSPAFQAVSADNHPIHYNVEYARSHGHTDGGRLSIIASDRTAADGRTFHSELIWLRV
jgi:hypothetical protein